MAKDLQQAENEARGEIIELNSGMDRIANVANSAAEKEASTSNRCASVPKPKQVYAAFKIIDSCCFPRIRLSLSTGALDLRAKN